jgi:predicted O-methyltransferase YrrM
MNQINLIISYFRYRLHAVNKYGIHSPFVYDLIVNVLEDHSHYDGYENAELRKKILIRDNRSITHTDFGANNNASRATVKISRIAGRECINKMSGRLLYRIVRTFKPNLILELGTSLGISTLYMASAHRDCNVISCEGCPEVSSIAAESFQTLAENNIRLIQGNFDQTLSGVLRDIDSLDLAFIDGNHRKEAVLKYYNQICKKVHENSILVFHDIHWSKEMEEAWKIIREDEMVKVTIDLFHTGLVFFKKELSKQDFIIRYA